MTLTALGEFTVGNTVPGTLGALVAASGQLQAQIAAYADFSVAVVPPSIVADIALCESMLASLAFNLTLGIQPPSIEASFELAASAVLLLRAQLQLIQDLFNLFAAAGVHLYAYDGDVDALGGELTGALSGGFPGGAGSDHCNALILATTIPATWVAMAGVFKTS